MLAAQEPNFSEEEVDAPILYKAVVFRVTARMTSDYHDLEGLEMYKLGRKVHIAIHGELVPMHLNPAAQRCTPASLAFELTLSKSEYCHVPPDGGATRKPIVWTTMALGLASITGTSPSDLPLAVAHPHDIMVPEVLRPLADVQGMVGLKVYLCQTRL